MGSAKASMDQVAISFGHCKAGDRNRLAEKSFQKALGENLFSKQTAWTEENQKGNQGSYLQDGRGE